MRAFVEPNEKNWKELSDVSAMVNQGGDRGPRGYQEGAIGISSTRGSIDRFAGYLLNSANIELRIPLTNPELLGNFAGALFVDQAMVLPCTSFSCLQELSFKEILARRGFGFSAGVGLRYNLPVGPISLDYAYAPLHQESRVHLLFGYSF
jgi:outer membrane protein assembly factor BamA